MHYPLHITVLCTVLWVLQDDVNAAKTGVSAEVLTSFAKNVASILSSTLLSDFQDSLSNQSVNYLGSLKKPPERQTLSIDNIKKEQPEATTKPSSNRSRRFAKPQTVDEVGRGFHGAYIADNPQYNYNPQRNYNPQFLLHRQQGIPEEAANLEAAGNVNGDARENSIDTDINGAPIRYPSHYHQPPNGGIAHLGQFGFHPRYHLHQRGGSGAVQPVETAGVEDNPRNEKIQGARITDDLNYHGPFNVPQHPSVYRHSGLFYSNGELVEGNGQPPTPAREQIEDDSSRLTHDQSQGQSALPGYDYGPQFHYRPPYHGGFYGHPGFYYGPFNGSFDPGFGGHPGDNSTNGQFPPGPHPFYGYGFPPPYQPHFNGHKPAQPQNPDQNSGALEQSPDNEQGNGNSTGNGYPYGFPGQGPFYGDFYPGGYPLGPFHVLPHHRFGHVFPDHFASRFKGVPFLPLHAEPFPLAPWYPFGGFYPHNGHRPGMHGNQKPSQGEQTAGEMPAMNSDAEVIPESSSNHGYEIRSLPSNRKEKILIPWPLVKGNDQPERGQELNQVS
ncbi:uncharacterized protein LOC143183166 [Calliopsis andreniformis]|uniref:uncharacterized protein LOC143183166 n=1 Tax=Calliopsis andreniformis TaxID=337506 RepID=UPI003FCDC3EF